MPSLLFSSILPSVQIIYIYLMSCQHLLFFGSVLKGFLKASTSYCICMKVFFQELGNCFSLCTMFFKLCSNEEKSFAKLSVREVSFVDLSYKARNSSIKSEIDDKFRVPRGIWLSNGI